MLPIKNNFWEGKNLDALKFFAQSLEDSLYDFNLSSYKLKILNTHLLCKEFILFYPLIKKEIISENAYRPIVEELLESLIKDKVIDIILKEQKRIYEKEIKNNIDNIDNLIKIINLLNDLLNYNYIEIAKKEIIKIIKNNEQKKKKELTSLIQIYFSQISYIGYSKRFIYNHTKKFFFSTKKIKSNLEIDNFLSVFNLKEKEFNILFKISKVSKGTIIKSAVKGTEFKIFENLPEEYLSNRINFSEKNKLYLEIKSIKGFDIFSAKNNSEELIEQFESLLRYRYHQFEIGLGKEVLIYDSEEKKSFSIDSGTNEVFKRKDKSYSHIAKNIEELFKFLFHLKMSLFPTLIAHKDVMKTDNINHQFITLWSGIESIFINLEIGKKRVHNMWETLNSLLISDYFYPYVVDIHNILDKYYKEDYSQVLQEINEPIKDFQKFLYLISLAEYDDLRLKIYEFLSFNNPLLINKISNLRDIFLNFKNINSRLKKHEKHVRWQFQRIYRARNMLVHSNTQVPYLRDLLENLHEYLDKILDSLIIMHKNNPSISNIEGLISKIKIEEEYFQSLIKEKSNSLNKENVNKIICYQMNY
ncbi:MAG: hypothetical protein LAT82_03030 [Nanoarchaeota archaeon]|nr:hypothetical protein [Nanoarchaeota archaeon]